MKNVYIFYRLLCSKITVSALIISILCIGNANAIGIFFNTTDVRLKYFTSTKQRDYPLPDEPITIRVDNTNFDGKTDKKGVVIFKKIPCNKEVTLYFRGKPQAVFKRYLKCQPRIFWIYYFNPFESLEGVIEQHK